MVGNHNFRRKQFVQQYQKLFEDKTLLRFKKFPESKNVRDKRGGGMEYHGFPSNICCVTVPKKSQSAFSVFQKNTWYRKLLKLREGGGYHDLPSKICCLTVLKKFSNEPFCFL